MAYTYLKNSTNMPMVSIDMICDYIGAPVRVSRVVHAFGYDSNDSDFDSDDSGDEYYYNSTYPRRQTDTTYKTEQFESMMFQLRVAHLNTLTPEEKEARYADFFD